MPTTTVAVVGSVNLDVVVAVTRLPQPGETVLGSDVVFRPGGKGGNQAVAASRLGAEAVLFAATGKDQFGADLRTALEKETVELSHLAAVSEATTGVALIAVDAAGENTIVVSPGANQFPDAIPLRDLSRILSSSAVLSLQLEIPLSTCLQAAAVARRAGAMVLLNAAPLPKQHAPSFRELLGVADVLVVNGVEASRLGEREPPGDQAGWARLAQDLCQLGPRTSVITRGASGAVAAADGLTHVRPAFAVNAVDTTGAGDCFCAALAVALAAGDPIEEAVRLACAAGALATTKLGAQQALPTAADVNRLLDEHRSA